MDEERLKRGGEQLDDLFKLYVLPSISKLASDLKTNVDTLIRVYARKEPISDALAKQLMYLWALKLGKVQVPVPKPVLERPMEGSVFDAVYKLVGKTESYKVSNIKDVLTEIVDDADYDGALHRVIPEIRYHLNVHFKGRLSMQEETGISSGTTSQVPEFRRLELEIIDKNEQQYVLIYGRGMIINSIGNLPVDKIIAVLKKEGKWEA
jgi:hypothetical protein